MKSETKKIVLTVINIVIVVCNLLLRQLTGGDVTTECLGAVSVISTTFALL